MRKRVRKARVEENRRWLEEQRANRDAARLVALSQRQPVPGLHLIRLPSIADGLNSLEGRR